MPGSNPPLLVPPELAPQPTDPKNTHIASKRSTSQMPRRLLMRSIPIIENGSNARKIDLAPTRDLAMVPLPPVVFTESVVVWFMGSGFTENEQLEPFGPEQVKLIELLKLFTGATVRL